MVLAKALSVKVWYTQHPDKSSVSHFAGFVKREENIMSNLTFKDILNSAITEFYGENSVKLLMLFAALNPKGQQTVIERAELCYAIPERYSKTIILGEQPENTQGGALRH